MFTDHLKQIGLTSEEAQIYEALLHHGPQSAAQIAQNTSVKRTYVYTVIQNLIAKGLVTENKEGRGTKFVPESPDKLMDLTEAKRLEVEQAKLNLSTVLPQLKSLHALNETKPAITYYEGIEGIKKILTDIYAPKTEPVYGCVDLDIADQVLPGHIMDHLIPLRIKNQVKAITLLANSDQAKHVQSKDGVSLRESQLLDKEAYPMPAEIDVYEDKIAMLSFQKGKFVGVLIQNQALATTLKSIFKKAFGK